MKNKKIKWLIYTVLVGLIPVLSRSIVWLVTTQGAVSLFNASDFIAFGLVLHISNINEIEHLAPIDKSWKTAQNGISIAFIAFYSVLFTLTLLGTSQVKIIDLEIIKYSSMVLSGVSLLISYSVYHTVSKLGGMA